MVIISQDGLKAIETEEIQYYFIAKGEFQNTLMVMPKNRMPEISWNILKIFSDKNLDAVKRIMRFLIRYANNCQDKISLEVDLANISLKDAGEYKAGEYCKFCRARRKNFVDEKSDKK